MKNTSIILLILLFCSCKTQSEDVVKTTPPKATTISNTNGTYQLDLTNPQSVVNALFYAAKKEDFDILLCLCDPLGEGDGDTKRLCATATIAQQKDSPEATEKHLSEYITAFENGRITGETVYRDYQQTTYAHVPFWFNHPMGESRSHEKMELVNRYGNWYLSSF